jgi:hypothetical protein
MTPIDSPQALPIARVGAGYGNGSKTRAGRRGDEKSGFRESLVTIIVKNLCHIRGFRSPHDSYSFRRIGR